MRPLRLLAPALLIAALAGCSTAATLTPSPSVPPVASPSAPAAPSAEPSEPAATPAPAATPDATGTPAPSLSSEESALIARLRAGVGVDCAPRRDDLPPGALYGIECQPGDPLVQRVGVYHYGEPNDAAFAYMTRMADAGIDANAGDCVAGTAGDGAYYPGDGEGTVGDAGVFAWENKALVSQRNGCFLDEFGNANVRLVCEEDYIGILGAKDDMADLIAWTWTYPDGYEPGTPDLPGLCIGPAAVAANP